MIEGTINSLNNYFFKIKNQLENLHAHSFTTEDYYHLIDKLIIFNNRVYENFKVLLKKFTDNPNELNPSEENFSNYYSDLEIYFPYFSIFRQIIGFLTNTKNISINSGIFILLNYFMTKLEEDTNFIIYPSFQLGCGYLNLNTILDKFSIKLKGFNGYELPIFSIPFLNNEEIFFNSTITHELGHYIEEKFKIYNSIEKELIDDFYENPDIRNILIDRYEKRKKEEPMADKWYLTQQIKSGVFEEYIKRLKKWVKEIISDIIGLKIIGLPYFFGFIKTVLINYPDSPGSDEHPPPWLRFYFLNEEIKENYITTIKKIAIENPDINIGKLFMEDIKVFENYFNKVKANQFENKIKLIECNIISNLNYKDPIINVFQQLYSKSQFKIYQYNEENKNQIITLVKLLNNYITPNEIIDIRSRKSKPADILNILNAGWLFYVYLIDSHYKLFNISKFDFHKTPIYQQKLNNLILKAIELSQIHYDAKTKYNQIIKNKEEHE